MRRHFALILSLVVISTLFAQSAYDIQKMKDMDNAKYAAARQAENIQTWTTDDYLAVTPADRHDALQSTPFYVPGDRDVETIIDVTVDSYASEASWDVYDYQTSSYLLGTQYFSAGYEAQQQILSLPEGLYSVDCWDTYGDGGISGTVTAGGAAILAWGTYDYSDFGSFGFEIVEGAIYGCTDPAALNYNPDATADDGSCIYQYGEVCEFPIMLDLPVVDYMDTSCGYGDDYISPCGGSYMNGEDVVFQFTVPENGMLSGSIAGSYTGLYILTDCPDVATDCVVTATGYAGGAFDLVEIPAGTYYAVVSTWPSPDCTDYTLNLSFGAGTPGCMDPSALNYDPDATFDDGSCVYELGELCDFPLEYLYVNDPPVDGYLPEAYAAHWYQVDVTDDFLSVEVSLCGSGPSGTGSEFLDTKLEVWLNCDDAGYYLYNDDNYAVCYTEYGASSLNSHISIATPPQGTYYVKVYGYSANYGDYTLNVYGELPVYGCTDPMADNYNPDANIDDGSCEYSDCIPITIIIQTASWGAEVSWDITDDLGTIYTSGSGYASSSYYEIPACLEEGWYNFNMYDSYGDGWNGGTFLILQDGFEIASGGLASGSFGTVPFFVGEIILGCTDENAWNYNPDANTDDGSCEYVDAPWGLTAEQIDETFLLEWNDPATAPQIEQYHDDMLTNAFYFYDTYANGFAHATRFDPTGVYDIEAAAVRILSEGDPYWPWPNATHGPVQVMIFDDGGGVPGVMLHDEYVTAVDGWATVYPGIIGMVGSFYVVVSHEVNWSTGGDAEGFGIDNGMDYPDNNYTYEYGVWYQGDWLGYAGDWMITAWLGGDYGLQMVTHSEIDPAHSPNIDRIASSIHDGTEVVDTQPNPVQFQTRELLGFDVFRDGAVIGSTAADVYMYVDDDPALELFTAYCYSIRALYDEGYSPYSNEVCLPLLGDPPVAPWGLEAMATFDDLTLSSGVEWSWEYDCDQYDCTGIQCADAFLDWIGDGFCDDGTFGLDFNCEEWSWDDGDCEAGCVESPYEPGDPCYEEVILLDSWCCDVEWDEFCEGMYQECMGGGGDCLEGEIPDCFGNCAPEAWLGDFSCDDGTYSWGGIPIFFDCEEYNFDEGDCLYDPEGMNLPEPGTRKYYAWRQNFTPETAVFNLADGNVQIQNPSRLINFELTFTYDGIDYSFTTGFWNLEVTGFGFDEEICGMVGAFNEWGQVSYDNPMACGFSGTPPDCLYDAPQNLTVDDSMFPLMLNWEYDGYEPPAGDIVENPFWVDDIPFYDAQNTALFSNDYDEVCPYSGSLSPDVVYGWEAVPGDYYVSICDSEYDTKIYVYDEYGGLLMCVDDSCNSPSGAAFRSDLFLTIPVAGTYYIIVDGYGSQSGIFNIEIDYGFPVLTEDPQPVKIDDPSQYVSNIDRECGVHHFNIYQDVDTGECLPGQLMDCDGLCFYDDDCIYDWGYPCTEGIGDGYCDDGSFGINFNCEDWGFDGGDCAADMNNNKAYIETQLPVNTREFVLIGTTNQLFYEFDLGLEGTFQVTADDIYLGWNESAPSNVVSGMFEVFPPDPPTNLMAEGFYDDMMLESGIEWSWDYAEDCEIYDCDGICADDYLGYLADGFCDDGTFGINFNCAEFNFDEGDCLEGCDAEAPYEPDDPCYLYTIETDDFCCDIEWDDWCEALYWDCVYGGGDGVLNPEEWTTEDRLYYASKLANAQPTVFDLADGQNQVLNVDRDIFFTLYVDWDGVVYTFTTSDHMMQVTGFNPGDYVCATVTANDDTFMDILGIVLESDPSEEACAESGSPEVCFYEPPINVDATLAEDESGIAIVWEYPGYEPPEVPDCGEAIIDALPFYDYNSNIGLPNDFDVSSTDGADYAYQITVTSYTVLDIDLCDGTTDFDTKLEIFTTDFDCVETTTGYYNDDACGLQSAIYGAGLDAGTYYIVVDGFSGQEGNFGITVQQVALAQEPIEPEAIAQYESEKSGVPVTLSEINVPVNDSIDRECGVTKFHLYGEFPAPTCYDEMIESLPYEFFGTNVGETDDWDVQSTDGADVAFGFEVVAPIIISADLCGGGTDFDTRLEVFTADFNCVGTTTGYYNDDACGLQSGLYGMALDPGMYYIVVDGYGGGTGNFQLNVWEGDMVASEPVDPIEAIAYETRKSGVEMTLADWNFPSEVPNQIIDNNREFIYMGSTVFLDYFADGVMEGCFYVTADDNLDFFNESAPSVTACAGACTGMQGDVNGDLALNVLDIVLIVGYILSGEGFDECQFIYADWSGDGAVNVLDIVQLVGAILGGGRADDATSVGLIHTEEGVTMIADGWVGAVQMTLEHDGNFQLQLTENAMVADYRTEGTTTTLIVVAPESDLFTTNDSFEISEVIAASSEGYLNVTTEVVPTSFALHNAYPNPFNPVTNLKLDLPLEGFTSVKVYNLVGQNVATLVDGYMDAGYHTITWNASNMPSGMYLIRAEVGSNVSTQKVMLLK